MRDRLVLGVAPSPSSSWSASQSFARLLSWSTPAAAAVLREAPLVNVWRSPEARSWGRTRLAAGGRLAALWTLLERETVVLSLGPRAAWLVWGEEWPPWSTHHYQRSGGAPVEVVIVPSPSGRSRVHNRPDARERTARFLDYWATERATPAPAPSTTSDAGPHAPAIAAARHAGKR